MNNFNTLYSNPKQAVLPILIQDYLDICDPVLTFDRSMGAHTFDTAGVIIEIKFDKKSAANNFIRH